MARKKPVEENDGVHLPRIIRTTQCWRHRADIGEACWIIPSNNGILEAICNHRAHLGGANGKPSPQSIRTKSERLT